MLRDQTGKFIQASIKAPGAAGVGGGESGIENKQQVALLAFWLWEVSCFLIRGEQKQGPGESERGGADVRGRAVHRGNSMGRSPRLYPFI